MLDPIKMLREGLDMSYKGKYDLYVVKGKQGKVFIIGEGINDNFVREITNGIKEKTGKDIRYLIVSKSQFEAMQSMGLVGKEENMGAV